MSAEVVKYDGLLAEVPPSFEHDGHKYEVRGDRIVRDGKEVCVLVSPGYGGGFCTWNDCISPMDPRLVLLVLAGKRDLLAKANPSEVAEFLGLGDEYVSLHGARDLTIYHVPLGKRFRLDEYDGAESVEVLDADGWTIA